MRYLGHADEPSSHSKKKKKKKKKFQARATEAVTRVDDLDKKSYKYPIRHVRAINEAPSRHRRKMRLMINARRWNRSPPSPGPWSRASQTHQILKRSHQKAGSQDGCRDSKRHVCRHVCGQGRRHGRRGTRV